MTAETGAIRRARPEEAQALTDLALRSKAVWGYDQAFLAACRTELTVTAEQIQHSSVFVYEHGRRPLAVYRLDITGAAAVVGLFFVDPAAIGQGVGTRLWRHLIGEARRRGVERIVVESDPNAEGFYLAMGASTVGAVPSRSIANRRLPLMELALTG